MDYPSIQAEKAKAMMKYRRLRNIAKMWRLLEILVVLALLSWLSTRLPVAVKLAGGCLTQIYEFLLNQHINFVIGNAIIIALVLLSRQNKAGNISSTGDLCDEYVQNSEALQRITSVSDGETPTPPPHPAPDVEETAYDDKQIVVSENAVTQMQCDAVSAAIEQATKQTQRFQRTQSEKLKRDLRAKPRLLVRRSETEITQSPVASSGYKSSSFDTVDRLSKEEFRCTIEEFIAKQQRFLLAQRMAEKNQLK